MKRQVLARVFVGFALLFSALTARGHDVMGTVFYIDLGRSRVHLEVEIPVDELRSAFGLPSLPGIAELPASRAEVATYLLDHLALTTPAGAAFALEAHAGDMILHDDRNWQRLEVDATPPRGASPRDFLLHTDVINHRVLSHHVFLFLRGDLETGQLGEPVYLDTLHYQIHDAHVRREAGSLGVGLWSVFQLGMKHIAEGSDHLLFLFTLLLPACLVVGVRRRWAGQRRPREALLHVVRIVTAFTLGHSVTLLVGALGFARLPTALVESLIACSVLVSALHVLVPLFPGREAWVALGFGFIHGLGFASALEGLGVDGSTLLLTVLGFNLGVEAMQALLVSITLPWLYLIQTTRAGTAFRLASGALAFVVALGWFAQRALSIETPLLGIVEQVSSHGLYVVAALALFALIARAIDVATVEPTPS